MITYTQLRVHKPSPNARYFHSLREDGLTDSRAYGTFCESQLLRKVGERTDESVASKYHHFLQHAHSESWDIFELILGGEVGSGRRSKCPDTNLRKFGKMSG